MYGHEVQVGHLLKQVGCWRRGGYCDANGLLEFRGFFGGTEKCVDSWGGVEMCDVLRFEKVPD